MLLKSLVGGVALAAVASAQAYPLELVYQFDNSFSGFGYVNIENVAVRSSNGQLLLNFATGAIMAQLNPDADNPVPEVIVNLTDSVTGAPGSLTGIAETGNDVFTVAAGSFQFGPQVPGGIAGIPGSFSVWSVDLTGPIARPHLIVAIPEAGALNGVTTIPGNENIVLIADSVLGVVWSVNVKTGEYSSVISSDLFLPSDTNNFGINGVEAAGPYLYFTNSAQDTFGAVPINHDGIAVGEVTPFITGPNGTAFDDFALDKQGNAWIATQPNAVYQVTRDSGVNLIAGGGDDQTLYGPTSVAFKGDILYVVTAGGFGEQGPTSGAVYAIDTSAASKRKAKKWVA